MLVRAGQTEGSVDLSRLAGLKPAEGSERLQPVRTGLVFTNRLLSVHALEFRTGFDRTFKTET